MQSYLTTEVPVGVRVYLPYEVDAAIAAKDLEIERWKMMHAQTEAQLNEYLSKTVAAEARERELRQALQDAAGRCEKCSGKGTIYNSWSDICARSMFTGEVIPYEQWNACKGHFDCETCKPIRDALTSHPAVEQPETQPIVCKTCQRLHNATARTTRITCYCGTVCYVGDPAP